MKRFLYTIVMIIVLSCISANFSILPSQPANDNANEESQNSSQERRNFWSVYNDILHTWKKVRQGQFDYLGDSWKIASTVQFRANGVMSNPRLTVASGDQNLDRLALNGLNAGIVPDSMARSLYNSRWIKKCNYIFGKK